MKHNGLNTRMKSLVTDLVSLGLTLEQARQEFEKQYIAASIRTHGGNLGRSARALGIHRNTLRNKVSKLDIDPADGSQR